MNSQTRVRSIVVLVAAIGCACSSKSDAPANPGPTNDAAIETGSTTVAGELAKGIGVDGIVIVQGTSVAFVKAGAAVASPNAPIVVGREAVVRLLVTTESTFVARDLVGRLTIKNGASSRDLAAASKPSGPSDENKLETSFNFDVPADAITTDTEIAVRIEEKGGATGVTGASDHASFPSTKLQAIAVGKLVVVLVPFRYAADGSNRVPDTGPTVVKQIGDGLAALFPVPSVELTVHATVDLTKPIVAGGGGWNEWLAQTYELRAAEAPKPNVIYVGLANPATDVEAYCKSGCVSSLSSNATATADPTKHGGVALGFFGTTADPDGGVINTAGLLARILGRVPAPCGMPSPSDAKYPHPGGAIGVPGYDRRSKKLLDPVATKDFTSYCTPVWTSDYTFAGMAKRLTDIDALK